MYITPLLMFMRKGLQVHRLNNQLVYLKSVEGSLFEVTNQGVDKNPFWRVMRNGKVLVTDCTGVMFEYLRNR